MNPPAKLGSPTRVPVAHTQGEDAATGKSPRPRVARALGALGMDRRSPLLSIEVESQSRAAVPWPWRVLWLSLKVRGLTIAQFPNAPLAIAFVGGLVGRFTLGSAHDAAQAVSVVAMTIWAYEELAHGVNWFRHALGLYSLVGIIVWLAGVVQG